MAASLKIGTSGWHYDHWEKIFYPRGLPRADWFSFYARFFDTVEINNSFYRLPSAETFSGWRKRAPRDFCYAVKFSRYGSHLRRLTDARSTIQYFLAAAERLGRKLGPILVQLPPRWRANPERLDDFLREAPSRHRWAVEFRDPSWLTEEVFSILEKHRAALCIHDMIADHPVVTTTDWTYLRYHGDQHHQGNYTRGALERAADAIGDFLGQDKDVYVYFNNDGHGYAIKNALTLGNILATSRARSSL